VFLKYVVEFFLVHWKEFVFGCHPKRKIKTWHGYGRGRWHNIGSLHSAVDMRGDWWEKNGLDDSQTEGHRVGMWEKKMERDVLHQVIPPDNVLWDIFHCVLEEEPILVTEYRLVVAFFKGDFVN